MRKSSIRKAAKRRQTFANKLSVQVSSSNSSLSRRSVVSVMSKRTSNDVIGFRTLALVNFLESPSVQVYYRSQLWGTQDRKPTLSQKSQIFKYFYSTLFILLLLASPSRVFFLFPAPINNNNQL